MPGTNAYPEVTEMRITRRTHHVPWRPLALAVAGALALGLAGRIAVHAGASLPHGRAIAAVGHTAVALGAPWLAVAWIVGTFAGSRIRGAVSGAAALVLGTGAWYLLTIVAATSGWAAVHYAVPVAAAWGVVALGAGGVFGFAGAVWREHEPRMRAAAIGLLTGALAGEALLLMRERPGRAAAFVLAIELAVGLGVLAFSRRRAPLAVTLLFFVVATVSVMGTEGVVRDALRLAGWGGP
jgi:hypothetical protein